MFSKAKSSVWTTGMRKLVRQTKFRVRRITRRSKIIEEGDLVRVFVEKAADREQYLCIYPDVAAAGIDPIEHWLRWGLDEGRELPGVLVAHDGETRSSPRGGWHRFSWRGAWIALKIAPIRRVSPRIIEQIMAQARHDLAVLAPGALALRNLRHFDATDLMSRDGIDVATMFVSAGERPAAVFIIPFLLVGGAEKYTADLVDALATKVVGPILVLVTEQTEKEAVGWEKWAALAPMQQAKIVFWRDACGGFGAWRPESLGRFVNALRPRFLVVVNSNLGLETVARFGRGMSQFSLIACAFFSMGVPGLGVTYGARFPRRIMPFALALTDNHPMAETLCRLHGEIPGPGIAILPPRVRPVSNDLFAIRLDVRRERSRASRTSKGRRWAWVSRIDPFKGTKVLANLAKARPADRFDVFGTVEGEAGPSELTLPNISLLPALPDVTAADFGGHDGFLFTSLFEGMPNVVLEMSQQAIPMVLADVGGLRQTLKDNAAIFVCSDGDTQECALAFSRALDRVVAMDGDALERMVTAAREQVLASHSPDAHTRSVTAIFGIG